MQQVTRQRRNVITIINEYIFAEVGFSPWVAHLGDDLAADLIKVALVHKASRSITTWCWQALYLTQPKLTDSQKQQLVENIAIEASNTLHIAVL